MRNRTASLSRASLTIAVLAMLGGCVTSAPPTNPGLQGSWRLDPAASDDASARIASAIRVAQARLKKNRRYQAAVGGSPGDPGTGAGAGGDDPGGDLGELGVGGGLMAPDFHALQNRLQQEVGSPRLLSLKLQSGDLLIQGDGLPARDYQLDTTETRFDEYGTAQIKSSWKDNSFILKERYTSGARLQEQFAVDGQGTLEYTRSLRDPVIGKLEFKSVYRRATP